MKSEHVGRVTVAVTDHELHALDEIMAQETEDFLLDLVDRAQPPVVVLDLSQTDYFDSRFIETMVRAWNRIKRRDGRFAVCGLKPFCREVIQTTKLDTIWDVFATRDEAVAALEKDG